MSKIQLQDAGIVGELYRELGFWRIAQALLVAMLRQRQRHNDIADLSDRMRQDIGAPVDDDLLKPRDYSLWSIRPSQF